MPRVRHYLARLFLVLVFQEQPTMRRVWRSTSGGSVFRLANYLRAGRSWRELNGLNRCGNGTGVLLHDMPDWEFAGSFKEQNLLARFPSLTTNPTRRKTSPRDRETTEMAE